MDSGTPEVLVEVADGVATVTLSRPERRNALTPAMLAGLGRVLASAETDDAVGAVVLTGAGSAFCAGGDVKVMAEAGLGRPPEQAVEQQRREQRATVAALWRSTLPVVAALPGPAAGGGLGLALACDLRYGSPAAVMTTAFARVGVSGDYGVSWFLTAMLGTARARELMLLPERLDAQECLRLGLLHAVVEDVRAHAVDVARRLASGPRTAHALMKRNLGAALTTDLEAYMDAEVAHHVATKQTEDHRRAVEAFARG